MADYSAFVKDYNDPGKKMVINPISGRKISKDGPTAKKIYREYMGLDRDEKYSEDYCEKFVDLYENSRAEKITSPITGKKILRNGPTSKKIYEECKNGAPIPRKGKKSPNDQNDKCKEFVKTYEKYRNGKKRVKIRSPISNRMVFNDGEAAERAYENCLNKMPRKRPTSPNKRRNSKDCLQRSKHKLKGHQFRATEFILKDENRGLIAAFDTGGGKTRFVIAASQCLLEKNKDAKVLVLVPKSLVTNFRKEMEKYGIDRYDPRYTIETIGKFVNKGSSSCDKNTILIVDEAHELRTTTHKKVKGKPTGKRARVLLNCAKKVWKVLLLTATPLYNNPYDFVNLISMIKGIDPMKEKQFWDMVNNPDTTEFDKYFSCLVYFHEIKNNKDYPKKIEHNIEIEMTEKYYQDYMVVERNNNASFENPFVFLTGLRQAANGIEESQKGKWALKKIKEILKEGRKVILYSSFLNSGIGLVKESLPKNIDYVEITGKKSIKERDEAVEDFNNDDVKVMFLTKAGGKGLDLRGKIDVILFEKGWNVPSEEQVIGRASRYKSQDDVPEGERYANIYHLILVKPKAHQDDKHRSADVMIDRLLGNKVKRDKDFKKRLITTKQCIDRNK